MPPSGNSLRTTQTQMRKMPNNNFFFIDYVTTPDFSTLVDKLSSVIQCQVSPETKTAFQSAMLGDANFKIRIHAPQQDVEDTLDALDSLLKLEEAVRRSDEEDYVAQKQRLLLIQKARIRDVVRTAFEPLLASLPNPIATAVTENLRPTLSHVDIR